MRITVGDYGIDSDRQVGAVIVIGSQDKSIFFWIYRRQHLFFLKLNKPESAGKA